MIRVVAIVAIALGIGAAAWVALLTPPVHASLHASPPEPSRIVATSLVPLRPLVLAFPDGASAKEAACPESHGHAPVVPLISYAAIAGTPGKLEQELLPEATSPSASAPGSIEAEDGRVAVLRTLADDEQEGRYEGRIVVFDGRSQQALCQTRVVVSSPGDLRWADVSPHALRRARVEAVRRAVQEAGARLAVELRLSN